jgi:hypothetical protein
MALIELARSLWHLLLFSSFLGSVAVLGICVYRLYFHPLAKYPGPLLAKLTTGYAVYHAYRRDLHTDIWACHEKYGVSVPIKYRRKDEHATDSALVRRGHCAIRSK